MKTFISALAVVAALGLAAAPAMAQQTSNINGEAVDGMGSGGNIANRYVFDGPANADVTSLTTAIGKLHSSGRVNRLDCDIVGAVNCNDTPTKHSVANSIFQ
jgi:methyl coenzyme M reductase subunit C